MDLKILQSNILSVGINTLLIIIMILLLRVIITIKSINSMSSKQLDGIKLVICIQEVHHHFQPGSIRLQEVIDLHLIIIHTHPGNEKPTPPQKFNFHFRPEIGHRRQRSLDQLRIDQLRIIDKNQSMSHEYDSSMDPIPSMAEEDFSQIEVQPLEIPDEIISQLIGPITTGTTGV